MMKLSFPSLRNLDKYIQKTTKTISSAFVNMGIDCFVVIDFHIGENLSVR